MKRGLDARKGEVLVRIWKGKDKKSKKGQDYRGELELRRW